MPEWSPDGSTLLIHTYPGSAGRIVALGLLDGSRRNVLDHQGSNPRLSPDAKKLAFIDRDTHVKVWDVDERFDQQLRSLNFATDWTPLTGLSWSPDNSRLACVREGQGPADRELIVLSMNAEAELLEVLDSGDIYRVVAWHPIKNAILFSARDQDSKLYQFRLFDLDKGESYPLQKRGPWNT